MRSLVVFEGRSLSGLRGFRIARLGIGLVPEGRRCFANLSVWENLVATAQGSGWTLEKVYALFPRLEERAGQSARTLSGGEQQMVALGRAVMAKPRLLLLDEPSLGIAPKLVQDIARSIVAINRDEKVSVLLVEQNSRMALRISHRVYALATGEVALQGVSEELLQDDRVRALYLGGEL